MIVLGIITLSFFFSTITAQHPHATSVDDFEYDNNDRLRNHQLLYHGNELCDSVFDGLQFPKRMTKRLDQPLLSRFYETSNHNNSKPSCFVVCLEKGVLREHVPYPLLDQIYVTHDNKYGHVGVADWVQRHCQMKEIGFLSYLDHEAIIYWINDDDERVEVGRVEPGEQNTVWMGSYLGHRFEIVHPTTEEIVGEVEVAHHTVYSLGTQYSAIQERDVRDLVRRTFEMEWDRSHRVIRTYTEFGFSKGRLPTDLFASMSAFYYNNADQATIEEWENKGVFVNWWETDVFFLPMPMQLKRYWQGRLKEMVEAWVGVPLELTDIYGMRRYEKGARLLTHVDREATHATSLIVNVAQGNIRKPWTIEIYDFNDRLHEIEMNPGDIVFYESARCLHGRMQPLQGDYYVNLFSHYRPVGDPSWFLKPNPPGNVEPALEIGECKRDGQKVHCSGHEVDTISPKLQTLQGPQDLYDFWVETSHDQTAQNDEL
eukprot:gene783-850_t